MLLISISITSSAQVFSTELGKISSGDTEYTECDFDKGAEAVVFFDVGSISFLQNDEGFDVSFTRHTRIKVLKRGGEKYATVEIPVYCSNSITGRIDDVEAYAYNVENNIVVTTKLDLKNFREERLNERWIVKKFAIPNVKVGTIIEYQYSIVSNYTFNLHDWNFQWNIPVLHSQYSVSMIPFYEYTYLIQGTNKLDSKTSEEDPNVNNWSGVSYHNLRHTFVMQNVPGFKNEGFITSTEDYIMKINFQLSKIHYPSGMVKEIITTWSAFKEELLDNEYFGQYIKKSKSVDIKELSKEYLSTLTTRQKFDTIINHIKNNYSWDKSIQLFANKKPNKLFSDKYGSSAELNLFCIAQLRKVGIQADPLLISTREHGTLKLDYPLIDHFNNVLIKVKLDSTIIVSDATDRFLPNNKIPMNCINNLGVEIDKDKKTKQINLSINDPITETINIKSKLENKKVISNIQHSFVEFEAIEKSREYGNYKPRLIKAISKPMYDIDDSSVEIKDMHSPGDSYNYCFNATIPVEYINNEIYLSPLLMECFNVNPFKQKERFYPIDMIYSNRKNYKTEITVPANYTIKYIPESKEFENQAFKLTYSATSENNIITIKFSYWFKLPKYKAEEYEELKKYYDDIISVSNQKVVLTRPAEIEESKQVKQIKPRVPITRMTVYKIK